MFLNTPAKKSCVALALVLPLVLAACGSKDEGKEGAQSSTQAASSSTPQTTTVSSAAPAASSSSSQQASQAPESDKNKSQKPAENKPAKPAPQAGAPAESLVNPFEGNKNPLGQSHPQTPVEGGQPANKADADSINGLVRGLYQAHTLRQFVTYIPDNACQEVLKAQGHELDSMKADSIPDVPLDQIPGSHWGSVGVKSIDNIKVKGDEASATVNVDTGQGTDSSLMRFKREGGRWTFCAVQ